MKKVGIFYILFTALPIFIFAAPVNAVKLDATYCSGFSGGLSWDAITSTCTVSNTVASWMISDPLTIPAGTKLINYGGDVAIISGGSINNYGIIDNKAGAVLLASDGTINNNAGGNIKNEAGGNIVNSFFFYNFAGGTIDNAGTFTMYSYQFHNLGAFHNTGTIEIYFGFENEGSSSTLENTGIINIDNNGDLYNAGTLDNAGTINDNTGLIFNGPGTINNKAGGIINNKAGSTINNNGGGVQMPGIINNNAGSTINNVGEVDNFVGTIDNAGTITNTGIITSLCGGKITGNPISPNPVQYPNSCNAPPGIPEFPIIALPVIGIIGLMFVFQKRKRN